MLGGDSLRVSTRRLRTWACRQAAPLGRALHGCPQRVHETAPCHTAKDVSLAHDTYLALLRDIGRKQRLYTSPSTNNRNLPDWWTTPCETAYQESLAAPLVSTHSPQAVASRTRLALALRHVHRHFLAHVYQRLPENDLWASPRRYFTTAMRPQMPDPPPASVPSRMYHLYHLPPAAC